MAKSLQRLNQISPPKEFDDTLTAQQITDSEWQSTTYADFQNAILSQLKRLIHGDSLGNWHDDPTQFIGDIRYLVYKQDVACLSSDSVGDWVCIRGDRTNGKWRVQKADPLDIALMPAIGVLISKSTPTVGVIQIIGPCRVFSGLDYTKPAIWLGTGGVQYVPPIAPSGGYVMAQRLGKAVASDILLLMGSMEMIKRVG